MNPDLPCSRRLWNWLAAASNRAVAAFAKLSFGGRWLWLGLLVLAVALIFWLKGMRSPWKTPWAADIANAQRHAFRTYLRVGLWWGTVFHLGIVALLLATVRWWGRAGAACYAVALGPLRRRHSGVFWVVLLVLCVAAGAVRWPKMNLSYWGDEGWAVAPYVYGKHVPVEPGNIQGALEHRPVAWENTAFDDRTCGNHYLFSLTQRGTLELWRWWKGLPADAFDETVSRLPPFAAGIGSLVLLALMLRWLGRPGAGLAAALMLALHPWHVRYSTEARGYTMMLFFLVLAVWLALVALRSGRWKWWLAFGAAEFLCMYSWKGVMYPLAAANGVLLLWVWLGRRQPGGNDEKNTGRAVTCGRLLVANLLAAGLFVNLVYPCVLQMKDAKGHLVQLSGRPMDRAWLDNSISAIFTGMSWHVEEKENPTELVMSQTLRERPWRAGLELGVFAALLLAGVAMLWRLSSWQAALWLSMLAAGAVGAACFRWIIGAEWIYWYFFFMTLPLAVLSGLGLDGLRRLALRLGRRGETTAGLAAGWRRLPAAVCGAALLLAPAAYADLTWPEVDLMLRQAYEDHRGAFLSTRGRHEPLHFKEPSKIHTIYVWRYISLYDPRGDTHVRDERSLRERIVKVEEEGGELYVVVGHRRMARRLNPDLMRLVQDPDLFEHVTTYWAPEELHCLHCYRYRHVHTGDILAAPASPETGL